MWLRRDARHRTIRPSTTKMYVAAWKSPSQRVLIFRFSTLVGGSPASVSIWCHCKSWCRTMPSKKPPRPSRLLKKGLA
jgi:hypothetical protein